MKTTKAPTTEQKSHLAVPYYGLLSDPRQGLAQLFFLVELEGSRELKLRVWNRRDHPRLGDWLRTQNVSGLLCREGQSPHLQELQREGFWVAGGRDGDAEEMVAAWLDSREAEASWSCSATGGVS